MDVGGEAGAETRPGHDKKMMKRSLSLPSMRLLDPAGTMKNSSLLKVANTGRAAAAEPNLSSRERSRWRQKKAISFTFDQA